MKIQIMDITDYYYRNWDVNGNKIYCFGIFDHVYTGNSKIDEIKKDVFMVRNTLINRFLSIKFESDLFVSGRGTTQTFYIQSKEDQIYFLLWTNAEKNVIKDIEC